MGVWFDKDYENVWNPRKKDTIISLLKEILSELKEINKKMED